MIEHSVEESLAQRIYALVLGCEDLNDHDKLRSDPLLAVLVGKDDRSRMNRVRSHDKGKALSRKCRRIIKHREHLWPFVQDRSVEPTNNIAERIVRQAVLWRKSSFGTQSGGGTRYVERILTVCATCRLQGRSAIEYLRETCRCHLSGIAAALLIRPIGDLAKTA